MLSPPVGELFILLPTVWLNRLDLSAKTKKAAVFISNKLANVNQLAGRSPVSVAATALYFACEVTTHDSTQTKRSACLLTNGKISSFYPQITDDVRTEEEICRVCGISTSTLNKVNKVLKDSLSFSRMISSTKIKWLNETVSIKVLHTFGLTWNKNKSFKQRHVFFPSFFFTSNQSFAFVLSAASSRFAIPLIISNWVGADHFVGSRFAERARRFYGHVDAQLPNSF